MKTTFTRTPVSIAAARVAARTATRTVTRAAAGLLLAALAGQASAVTYTWSSGSFVPGTTAPSPLAPADTLAIQTAASHSFDAVSFVNNGTVQWQAGASSIVFISGASVSSSGLWDAQGDAALIYGGGAAPSFNNSGTLRKSGGTGTTTIGNSSAFLFVNSGTINAQTGTIAISGSNTFNAGSSFTGAGSVVVNTASTFNGGFQSSNLTLAAGTLTGNAAVLAGSAAWAAGTLTGTWTVGTGATLAAQTAGGKVFESGSFTNNGVFAWQASSGGLVVQSGAAINNTGVWDARGDSAIIYGGGAATTFTNNGTLRKSAGDGVTQIGNSSASAFVNNGVIDAQTGTLQFSGANSFNGGTVFTGAGSVVVNTASTFSGAIQSSNLRIAAGLQTGNNAALAGQAVWAAGTLSGGWKVGAGSTLATQGSGGKSFDATTFNNDGTFAWDATSGSLVLTSGAGINNAGVWDAQGDASMVYGGGAASTFTNTGTLRKSGGTGTTQISNSSALNVVNSGTVQAQTGTLLFSGNSTFNPGSVFSGAGSVVVNSAAAFNGGFQSSNLTLAGGTQTGAAARLSGQAAWNAGTLAGTWSVAPGATLNVATSGGKNFSAAGFTNDGTVAWQAGSGNQVLLSGSAVVNNGLWLAQGDASLVYGGGGASSFVNNGTLRKTGGSGTTALTNSTALSFVNNGTVDVQAGTIQLPGNFSNAGRLTGNGTLQTGGVLTNNGTLAPTGGSLTQAAGASFEVDVMSLAAFDLLTVGGAAALNGTLALNCFSNCSFAVGDTFTILDASGALSGSFASVTLSGFGTGAFSVVYDLPTASVRLLVTEAVTAVPEPGSYALLLAGMVAIGLVVRRRRPAMG